MNVNFGLFSPLPGRIPKKLRGAAYAERALEGLEEWMRGEGQGFFVASLLLLLKKLFSLVPKLLLGNEVVAQALLGHLNSKSNETSAKVLHVGQPPSAVHTLFRRRRGRLRYILMKKIRDRDFRRGLKTIFPSNYFANRSFAVKVVPKQELGN